MGLITLAPNITRVYGKQLPAKARAIGMKRAQAATLAFQFLDDHGNPIDLTQYGFEESSVLAEYTVVARFIEGTELSSPMVDSVGTVENAETGQVQFDVPLEIANGAGVYRCEVAAFNNGVLILSNIFYVFVERGLFSAFPSAQPGPIIHHGIINGPPTLDEIRVTLRDAPEANRLTDTYEFDIADICEATIRSVQYWNAAPPQMQNYLYDTRRFPFRDAWRDGIACFLFEAAATYYRRVTLPYQGGGVEIDDLNKEPPYLKAAEMFRQRFETYVRRAKVQLNMNDGFGTVGSFYGVEGW